ncbi:hypothetical protein AX769_15895 [Frondihabitans sp. PAMC 28766]|uniref:GNAT family N-acetyltransferase n=1 Tax=Frondihabitans sp. PAMC 28766 TaxID=1795630 RepID=UPI00078DAFA0|nr:GNAT family N-acetyltransferase [Frondihabitans sp. PAMC 28766]AMM21339.1 hypothetical protein AX769_15895 [Frondihabitans sp. PAMC 28766]
MTADVSLEPFTDRRRPLAERLWQLYKHDMSAFTGSAPDADGLFRPGRLPMYFTDSDAVGFFIVERASEGDAVVGFASVFRLVSDRRAVGDFFVLRGARRRGVGEAAARQLLRCYPGLWSITFQSANVGAGRFWRGITAAAVGSAWTEEARPVPGRPDVPPDVWLLLSVDD